MAEIVDKCVFCGLTTTVRGHHLVPKSKGGGVIVPTCQTCENFCHSTWSHNELRDIYNTVDLIKTSEKFMKFLKWRLKQPPETLFKSARGCDRCRRKYSCILM